MEGWLCPALFKYFEQTPKKLYIQIKAVAIVTVWTAVVATVAFLVVKAVMGLRVTEEQEREGLDITSHGERAYDM